MTTPSKTKSYFGQLLSEISARRYPKNSQKVSMDCLKPRSNKSKFECKNCGYSEFYVLDYQNYWFKMLSSL